MAVRPSHQMMGATRIANALRLRLEANYDEMEEKILVCEGAFALVDDVLVELHEKTQTAQMLQDALTRLEFHLQRSGAYYISDELAQVIRASITEVGADKPRFCVYLGVENINKIPVHRFDEALAALEAKRRRAA
jgi:hypothetical protein